MINLTLSDQLLRNQSRCDQTFGEIAKQFQLRSRNYEIGITK